MAGEGGEGTPKDPEADLRRDFTFSDEEKKSSGKTARSKISTGAAAIGGGVATEVGRRLFNAGTEKAREVLGTSRPKERAKKQKSSTSGGRNPPGEPPGEPPEHDDEGKENPIHNAAFAKVMSMSNDGSLARDERDKWIAEKNSRIEDFRKFDGGDFVDDTERRFKAILRTSEWDAESGKGVYDKLITYSESRDLEYKNRHESEPRLNGLIGIALRAEAARVLVAGIDNKFEKLDEAGRANWLKKKNYSDNEVARLRSRSTENHIFDFTTDAPEELVGSALEKEPSYEELMGGEKKKPLSQEEYIRMRQLRGESLVEIPLHTFAVFEGGKNYVHDTRTEIIPILELRDPDHRKEFIFRNIYAFDYVFNKPTAWKGAIDDWLADVNVANLALGEARLSPKEMEDFEKELKAMMAVTASARAMEMSTGVPKDYLETLVGLDPKGNPNLDNQDKWDTFLLHADPNKMKLALQNSTVERYYRILMADAGLVYQPHNEADALAYDPNDDEWQEYPDPDDPNKMIQIPSKLVWTNPSDTLRVNNRLIEYLKNGARKGGLQKYIEEVLMEEGGGGESREVRMAAARIACDTFMVDKYSRWEFEVTAPERLKGRKKKEYQNSTGVEIKIKDLNLQPLEDWGGDPLRSVIEPSFVSRRLKKVYSGPDSVVLDLVDAAIRPDYIFDSINANASNYEAKDMITLRAVVPSMVTNLKTYSRISDAAYKMFGGSMATGLPSWTPDTIRELTEISDLLFQVYGTKTVKEVATGRVVPIGKHIEGAQMMLALHAKGLATALESQKPDFAGIVSTGLFPDDKNRPFLEVMHFLYGADLKARSGYIQSLQGGRTRLVIRDNMFNAYGTYQNLYNLLYSNDQTRGSAAGIAKSLNLTVNVLSFMNEAFFGAKRR